MLWRWKLRSVQIDSLQSEVFALTNRMKMIRLTIKDTFEAHPVVSMDTSLLFAAEMKMSPPNVKFDILQHHPLDWKTFVNWKMLPDFISSKRTVVNSDCIQKKQQFILDSFWWRAEISTNSQDWPRLTHRTRYRSHSTVNIWTRISLNWIQWCGRRSCSDNRIRGLDPDLPPKYLNPTLIPELQLAFWMEDLVYDCRAVWWTLVKKE